MSPRVLAAVLTGLSLLVGLAGVLPLRRQATVAADEYRALRDQRQAARSRLQETERREATFRQAIALVAAAPVPADEAVRRVRRSVLAALDGASLRGVRLSVRPGRSEGAPALVRLSGSGPADAVLDLTNELARPQTGLVLRNVRFSRGPAEGTVSLDIEAFGFAAGAP